MCCISHSSQVHGVCKLSKGVLFVQVINGDVEWYWFQYQSLGTALLTGLQVIPALLITALPARQFNQFSLHFAAHLSSLHFIDLSVRMLWETVLKAWWKSR